VSPLMVCVKSCQQDRERGYHQIIRQTWGQTLKSLGVETRFFVGKSTHPTNIIRYEKDEVAVDAPDDYNGLPYKTRAIVRWASGKMVDNIFLCDTDTYVKRAVLKTGFESYDYAGVFGRQFGTTFYYDAPDRNGFVEKHPKCYAWASGGWGYYLSQRAIGLLHYEAPTSWAEDLWVGQVLSPLIMAGEITGKSFNHGEYSLHFPQAKFGGSTYDPKFKWMEEMHSENR